MKMIRWHCGSIKWASQWWHHATSAENHFSNCTQISCFGHPLGTENGMLCCKERHPLLLDCFITLLWYIKIIIGDSDSKHKPLMVHIMTYLSKITPKFHAKYLILGTLSAWELGCCGIRRDIYCFLGVSKPLFYTWWWLDEVLAA